jgi:hypothetical protein
VDSRATLRVIDANPELRALELAAQAGRPTAEFRRDVRKLKERADRVAGDRLPDLAAGRGND